MPKQADRLVQDEPLKHEVLTLLGLTKDRPSIAYVGPSLDQGRMDAILLADGLKGYARFVNRVAQLQLGILGDDFRLEVVGEPQSGSLEVFVHFFHSLAEEVRNLSDSKLLVGLGVICTLTGLSLRDAGKSLLWLFKRLQGRPITDANELPKEFGGELPISTAELIKAFNDSEVQAALRATLRPLRRDGYELFETRRNRRTIEALSKNDLLAADAAEVDALTADEVKVLDIEKVSFLPHLAWHLSEDGKAFDARIEDSALWDQIAGGERFGYGDRLRVTLHTEATRGDDGRLKLIRTVTRVHDVERYTAEQRRLF